MIYKFNYTAPNGDIKHIVTCADNYIQAEKKVRFLAAFKLGIPEENLELTYLGEQIAHLSLVTSITQEHKQI